MPRTQQVLAHESGSLILWTFPEASSDRAADATSKAPHRDDRWIGGPCGTHPFMQREIQEAPTATARGGVARAWWWASTTSSWDEPGRAPSK